MHGHDFDELKASGKSLILDGRRGGGGSLGLAVLVGEVRWRLAALLLHRPYNIPVGSRRCLVPSAPPSSPPLPSLCKQVHFPDPKPPGAGGAPPPLSTAAFCFLFRAASVCGQTILDLQFDTHPAELQRLISLAPETPALLLLLKIALS